MKLKFLMFGDEAEILNNFTVSKENVYVNKESSLNVMTGKIREYWVVGGTNVCKGWVNRNLNIIGYMPDGNGIWNFSN